MDEVEDRNKETIEELLTSDDDSKDSKKKERKLKKKQDKKAKKESKALKKKERKERVVTEEEKELKKSKRKRLIINYIIILFFLLILLVGIVYFIPKIKLNGEKNIKIEYGDHFEDPGCTASYHGEDITDKIWYDGEVNENIVGKYIIKCKIRKNRFIVSKERIVEIVDTKKPEIELKGELQTSICPNTTYQEEGFTANDNYDGDLTDNVKKEEIDNEIIYTVSDSSGNIETAKRTVVKEDKTAPVITLNGNETTYVTVGNEFNDPGVTAMDNCDENLTESVQKEGSVDKNTLGTYTIKYTVTDKAGNKTEKERKVVVQQASVKRSSNFSCGEAGVIYLTFDDGPNNSTTTKILDILKKYNVKATFFVTNTNGGSDSQIKREHDEGHLVALHTSSHDYSKVYASDSAYWNDLNKISDRVERITGQKSKIIRFPGGSSNTVSRHYSTGIMSRLVNDVESKGYKYFDWNVDSRDAEGKSSSEIYSYVTSGLSKSNGNVVLMHDIKTTTANALENIINYGLDHGYTFKVLNSSIQCWHKTNN